MMSRREVTHVRVIEVWYIKKKWRTRSIRKTQSMIRLRRKLQSRSASRYQLDNGGVVTVDAIIVKHK